MDKKVIIIIVVAVLLAGGGGAAAVLMLGGGSEPAEVEVAEEVVEQNTDPIFVQLNPPFTVNFQSPGALRYLQTEIQLMHTNQAVIDEINKRIPIIRNNLIMILSEQTFDDLRTRDAKDKIRAQISASIGETVGGEEGVEPPVEVLLTKFIMQ